jgi:tRNA modification GTPase
VTAPATYVVLLTPTGRGAVATLVVEGPLATAAVESWFRPAAPGKTLRDFACGRIVFGRWCNGGEEIVACRTGNQQVELSCHGGRLAAQRIERDLVQRGCRSLDWADWLHVGREAGSDTIEAEARIALAQARTERTAGILLDQLQGALRREMTAIGDLVSAHPDQVRQRLQILLDRSALGLHLTTPWRIVLAGRPNVGKSSLINALVGYTRAIVFDQPGTTRDVVTATAAIDGWPVELADTAGLQNPADTLEAAGIKRARAQMTAADVLLLVFDLTRPWTREDATLLSQWPQAIPVFSKLDLLRAESDSRPRGLETSAVTRQGIDELLRKIASRLVLDPPAPGSAIPFTDRQVRLLQEWRTSLLPGVGQVS